MILRLLIIAAFLTNFSTLEAAKKRRPASSDKYNDTNVTAPVDNEVCFSPDKGCDVKLWKFFQSATKSLDIAVYDITHPKLVHEILVASKKIAVRVVVDQRQSKGTHSLVSTLIKGKVPVKFGYQRGIMHHKFTLVDGKRLETGSYNYSDNATFRNQENQIYLSEPTIVKKFQDQFEQMWKEGRAPKTDLASVKG